eukprot:m51a1_g14723 hypothetical protein (313) ;mRNA; r:196764-197838
MQPDTTALAKLLLSYTESDLADLPSVPRGSVSPSAVAAASRPLAALVGDALDASRPRSFAASLAAYNLLAHAHILDPALAAPFLLRGLSDPDVAFAYAAAAGCEQLERPLPAGVKAKLLELARVPGAATPAELPLALRAFRSARADLSWPGDRAAAEACAASGLAAAAQWVAEHDGSGSPGPMSMLGGVPYAPGAPAMRDARLFALFPRAPPELLLSAADEYCERAETGPVTPASKGHPPRKEWAWSRVGVEVGVEEALKLTGVASALAAAAGGGKEAEAEAEGLATYESVELELEQFVRAVLVLLSAHEQQ